MEQICDACQRAKIHARRHGNKVEFVTCRTHGAIQHVAAHVHEDGNPSNVDIEVKGPGWAFGRLPRRLGKWHIIAISPQWLEVPGSRDAMDLFLVRVARVQDGEYVGRHHAVMALHDEIDGEVVPWTWHLVHNQENVAAVALALAMFGEGRTFVDTATFGKAPADDRVDDHFEYIQRDKCGKCIPLPCGRDECDPGCPDERGGGRKCARVDDCQRMFISLDACTGDGGLPLAWNGKCISGQDNHCPYAGQSLEQMDCTAPGGPDKCTSRHDPDFKARAHKGCPYARGGTCVF